jgi:hypothetical protein
MPSMRWRLPPIHPQTSSHLRRDARWPVEPGIALGPGQLEHVGHRLRAVDQFALELGQAHLVGLRLDHLVDGARLQQ